MTYKLKRYYEAHALIFTGMSWAQLQSVNKMPVHIDPFIQICSAD